MSFIETLRQLGREIQQDERYLKLQEATKNNDADEVLQDKIGKLNLIIMQYNQEAEKEDKADEEKVKKLNEEYGSLYTEIMAMEPMAAYKEAQGEVEKMANYISQMIGLFLNGEDPATCEPQEQHSCDGSCGSCGGCH